MDPGVVDFEIPNLEDADFTSSTSLVSVLVGDDMVEFKIPSTQLSFWSPFFGAACSAKWQPVDEPEDEFGDDSNECIVELSEYKPATFKAFVIWMHTGALGNITFNAEVEEPDADKTYLIWRLKWLALAECWVLGDYLQVDRFCNAAMDQMITMLQDCYRKSRIICCHYIATLDYVYSHTMDEDSPLRLLVVDTSVARVPRKRLVGSISSATTNRTNEEYRLELLNAMVIQARQGGRALDPWSVHVHRCRYHNHRNEDADYKCPFTRL